MPRGEDNNERQGDRGVYRPDGDAKVETASAAFGREVDFSAAHCASSCNSPSRRCDTAKRQVCAGRGALSGSRWPRGHSEYPLMTHKVITVEFIVRTVIASVLGIALAICAVYLADSYLGPLDQTQLQAPSFRKSLHWW